jgi:hypothetical protein
VCERTSVARGAQRAIAAVQGLSYCDCSGDFLCAQAVAETGTRLARTALASIDFSTLAPPDASQVRADSLACVVLLTHVHSAVCCDSL